MTLARLPDPRPGVRAGVAAGTLGLALLVTAFGLLLHASGGDRLPAGEPLEITGTAPVRILGLVEPGRDAREPARCTVESAAGTETVTVATGVGWESVAGTGLGRKLHAPDGEPATLVCDRRVAVTAGPAVLAYPLADYAFLYPAYLILAGLGFGYARRRSRSLQSPASPVQAGDDADRSELRGFAVDVGLSVVRMVAGVAAILLGIVAALAFSEGSPAGLVFLLPAVALGLVAMTLARRSSGRGEEGR